MITGREFAYYLGEQEVSLAVLVLGCVHCSSIVSGIFMGSEVRSCAWVDESFRLLLELSSDWAC